MVSKKDFQEIANILRTAKQLNYDTESTLNYLQQAISNFFKRQNSRFDKQRFIRACNGE